MASTIGDIMTWPLEMAGTSAVPEGVSTAPAIFGECRKTTRGEVLRRAGRLREFGFTVEWWVTASFTGSGRDGLRLRRPSAK